MVWNRLNEEFPSARKYSVNTEVFRFFVYLSLFFFEEIIWFLINSIKICYNYCFHAPQVLLVLDCLIWPIEEDKPARNSVLFKNLLFSSCLFGKRREWSKYKILSEVFNLKTINTGSKTKSNCSFWKTHMFFRMFTITLKIIKLG
jgi:hypothetical protein